MTHPGQPGTPFPPQGVPQPEGHGAPGPARPPTPPGKPGTARRIGGIAAAVLVAGGVAAFQFGGFGSPGIGDCVAAEGADGFTTVGCDDESAVARVTGVVEGEVSEAAFDADPDPCTDFPSATVALWDGGVGGDGTVYCGEPL